MYSRGTTTSTCVRCTDLLIQGRALGLNRRCPALPRQHAHGIQTLGKAGHWAQPPAPRSAMPKLMSSGSDAAQLAAATVLARSFTPE